MIAIPVVADAVDRTWPAASDRYEYVLAVVTWIAVSVYDARADVVFYSIKVPRRDYVCVDAVIITVVPVMAAEAVSWPMYFFYDLVVVVNVYCIVDISYIFLGDRSWTLRPVAESSVKIFRSSGKV